jgi:adenosine deaminase
LIDLHRHLEGSLRPATVAELTGRSEEEARALIQLDGPVADLVTYLRCNERAIEALVDVETCARVAAEAVEDAAAEGLERLELRFSPLFMSRPHGLDPVAVVEAVASGVRTAAREHRLSTALIGIMSRTFGPESCERELNALLTRREQIAALDLAGDEAAWPGQLFEEHFRRGRDAGWHVTVHAGEAAGPSGVRHAIEHLGAERIGHGVRAIEDPWVVELLAEREIPLEISLTSNVQTRTVASYADHPLKQLMSQGVRAVISTDNPTASATTLPLEFAKAAPAAGLSAVEIAAAQRTAAEYAFA